ncbi:uncharacterized protein LOC142242493 [Haematobia irritans]|uniref:uncharacterized protein LOC142242493 n=1 Tax=Haematobia irritans TaxID=7368 RepID=UPI003F4FC12E
MPPYNWKTFVANKVSEILENVGNVTWRHVPTADNPADIGTRGCTASELSTNSLWWHGPKWLLKSDEFWPKSITFKEPDLDRKVYTFYTDIQTDDILDRFSSFDRALRVLCYIYRFVRKCKNQTLPSIQNNFITKEEVMIVKFNLIRWAQKNYYPSEYQALESNMPISSKSKLLTLNPKLDEHKLLQRATSNNTA